jgi:uncharacterized DUF497 family protein
LIDFDPAKDVLNQGKHGLSLALARQLDWDNSLVWVDERRGYGESRMIALAPATGILYDVAYVDRARTRRVISLRRANRREVKHYGQSLQAPTGGHAHPGRSQGDQRRSQG